MAAQLLEHEPAHAGTRVKHSQDKERLKHDGEVIPDAQQAGPADGARENLRHSNGERRRSAT
jgi:hypothetical protein